MDGESSFWVTRYIYLRRPRGDLRWEDKKLLPFERLGMDSETGRCMNLAIGGCKTRGGLSEDLLIDFGEYPRIGSKTRGDISAL